MSAAREMTLFERIEPLPKHHRVRREYEALVRVCRAAKAVNERGSSDDFRELEDCLEDPNLAEPTP